MDLSQGESRVGGRGKEASVWCLTHQDWGIFFLKPPVLWNCGHVKKPNLCVKR